MTKKVALGFSFIELGWKGNIAQGMPSVYFGQKGLVDYGFETHYVVFTNRNDDFDVHGIHCHYRKLHLDHSNKNAFLYYLTDRLYWYEIWNKTLKQGSKLIEDIKPDILIAHGRYCVPAVYTLGKRYGIKTVYREYGCTVMYKAINSSIQKFLLKPQFYALKKPMDLYVFTDDGTRGREVALSQGVDDSKILFLKNGVFDCNDVIQLDSISCDSFNICSAARLSPEKYFDILLKAVLMLYNKIKEINVYIIGDGSERKKLEILSKELGITHIIHFEGGKNREEVFRYYKSCDVSVCLGSINPLLESMSCGIPVVTLDLGATGEIIHNKDNGLKIEHPVASELAEAIEFYWSNKQERIEIGKKGFDTIRSMYDTWDERIKKEMEAYMHLINQG